MGDSPHPAVFAPVSRRVGFLQTTQGVTPTWGSEQVLSRLWGNYHPLKKQKKARKIGLLELTFYVFSRILNLQIHAHIYRSFIRHHKMLGVRIAKTENRASKARKPLRHKTLLLHLFCQHPTEQHLKSSDFGCFLLLFATF